MKRKSFQGCGWLESAADFQPQRNWLWMYLSRLIYVELKNVGDVLFLGGWGRDVR